MELGGYSCTYTYYIETYIIGHISCLKYLEGLDFLLSEEDKASGVSKFRACGWEGGLERTRPGGVGRGVRVGNLDFENIGLVESA